mmetsp:Transcript_20926/g.54039  ORF Transcript_20926/g.54039 Transcript_20926/m.54039 type:complete len:90 (-) Transcript_20926:13-282(-)
MRLSLRTLIKRKVHFLHASTTAIPPLLVHSGGVTAMRQIEKKKKRAKSEKERVQNVEVFTARPLNNSQKSAYRSHTVKSQQCVCVLWWW